MLRSSSADGHHGGLENLTARLEAIGGRLTVTPCDGQFELLAEVPTGSRTSRRCHVLELKILLAEDVAMVRGALVALIELEPDLKVVASVENGADILPTALASQPDIAVIDIDLPGLDGLSAAAQLHEKLPPAAPSS